ncbi:MAG: peptidase MA family metallohydrolase [Planctomycetaceae bacterium]
MQSERNISSIVKASVGVAAILLNAITNGLPRAESAPISKSISECQELLRTGQYEECLAETSAAIADRSYGEEWPVLKTQCELATGRYEEAMQTIAAGIERYSWSVRLRMLEHQAAMANGRKEQAAEALTNIEKLVSSASWRYTDADDLVALGQAALVLGADARDVQEGFFDRARRNFKTRPDGVIAAGHLANQKGDFEFAGEILLPAIELFESNPELLFEASEALKSSGQEASAELLKKTLEINPRFAPAMHRIVEQRIDSEAYQEAIELLEQVFAVNANSPEGHALRAVIYHLQYDSDGETQSLDAATKYSGPNAEVLHLIGRKLSQKYRFAEGAAYQRRALEIDPGHNDSRIQLAQDLLRLGEEEEGWKLAEQAYETDAYNTTIFNLLQLRDGMQKFVSLESEHFVVRMDAHEARVYGSRAVELLESAYQAMVDRYEFVPEGPIILEMFDRKDDFAVRTFGIPDVAGFLGVCFGKVITANSPATRRDSPANWESVLWHEFCHVVTLQMTSNRIPRWLSEGISVYEERRKDSRWGQRMDATCRDRILNADNAVTPIRELSSAFLNASDGSDINFAYFESSMVVEHLVNEHGLKTLIAILNDLNTGLSINDALERHTGGLEGLESSFATYLRAEAERYAPGVSFDSDDIPESALANPEVLESFVKENPNCYPAVLISADISAEAGHVSEAEKSLLRLITLVPDDSSTSGPRKQLAALYRQQGRLQDEQAVLQEHLNHTADDLAATLRLQELALSSHENALTHEQDESKSEVLSMVVQLGYQVMAIDPFQTAAVSRMADGAEALNDRSSAIMALTSLLQLRPDDGARLNYRLGLQHEESNTDEAKRFALKALENAPRFREAHRLLLKLHRHDKSPESSESQQEPNEESAGN